MDNIKILIRGDEFCRLIPDGNFFKKERGKVGKPADHSKRLFFSNYIPEYRRMIDAGFVDMTNCFSPISFSEIKGSAVLINELLKESIEIAKNKYSIGQILIAEAILDKAMNTEGWKQGEVLADFYRALFIPKSSNRIEDAYELLMSIKSATNVGSIPAVERISPAEIEARFNVVCNEAYIVKNNVISDQFVFHSSPKHNWLSILKFGLETEPPKMEHGNSYGKGIYISKTKEYTNSYLDNNGLTGIFSFVKDNKSKEYDWGYVCNDNRKLSLNYLIA